MSRVAFHCHYIFNIDLSERNLIRTFQHHPLHHRFKFGCLLSSEKMFRAIWLVEPPAFDQWEAPFEILLSGSLRISCWRAPVWAARGAKEQFTGTVRSDTFDKLGFRTEVILTLVYECFRFGKLFQIGNVYFKRTFVNQMYLSKVSPPSKAFL